MRRGTRQKDDYDLECGYKYDSRVHHSKAGVRKWAKRILAKRRRKAKNESSDYKLCKECD